MPKLNIPVFGEWLEFPWGGMESITANLELGFDKLSVNLKRSLGKKKLEFFSGEVGFYPG